MKTEEGGAGFLSGFLIGGLVGAAVALLLTPRSGEETREGLMERGIELKVKAEEVATKAREEAGDLLSLGKTVLEEQKSRFQEAVEEGKEAAAQRKAELLAKYRIAKETGEAPEEPIAEVAPPELSHPEERPETETS